jgi:TPR repeat protein
MSNERDELGHPESMLEWITGNEEDRAYQAIEERDYDMARSLLESVAARNSIYSQLTLGALYEAGNLGPPNLKTALSYYERAANQGSAEAQRRLGRILVDQGEALSARTVFEQGAEAGNVSCMYWLGKLMLEGRGGAVEVCRGIDWLERAAAEGHVFAKRELLRLRIQTSRSIFRRSIVWLQIVMLAIKAGKAAATNPDVDILR